MDTHSDMYMDDDWTQKVRMLILATSATDHQKIYKTVKSQKTLTVIIASKLVDYWNDRIYYEITFFYQFKYCSKINAV